MHETAWPAADLEHLDACPVCDARSRQHVLYERLRDRVHPDTPGEWTLWRCGACEAGYLNPRPTRGAIGRLYHTYYTHAPSPPPAYADLGPAGRLLRRLGNGYRNWRFGTRDRPASALGVVLALVSPRHRALLDAGARHLPRSPKGRLLDLGCGSGDFLELAARAGWEAVGADPDPTAVAAARSRGLAVDVGSVETVAVGDGAFDGITMNHVIEHVHDPRAALQACHRLLKPGGWLWIETPNLDAPGHAHYRDCWAGLDLPRHLVLFTWPLLVRVLRQAGFARVETLPYYPLCARVFAMSRALRTGASPQEPPPLPPQDRRLARRAERAARRRADAREFLLVRAWKGD